MKKSSKIAIIAACLAVAALILALVLFTGNDQAATPDEYFIFTELEDGTYSVKAKDVNNMPADVIIPSDHNGKAVTSIGDYAFESCKSLTNITIPDSVTSIGSSAFSWCESLTGITIPDGVTSIGDYAFYDCASLTNITVDEGNAVYYSSGNCLIEIESQTLISGCNTSVIPESVTSIGDRAFYLCESLTNITIPDSVTSIGKYALCYCDNLTSVTIGNGVTSIGSSAFSYCTSLKDVYYTGTSDQWSQITIGSYNDPLENATIHYNYGK